MLASCGGGGGGSSPTPPLAAVSVTCPNGVISSGSSQAAAEAVCPNTQIQSMSPAAGAVAVSPETVTGVSVMTDSTLDLNSLTSANMALRFGSATTGLVSYGAVTADGAKGFTFLISGKLKYGQAYTFLANIKDALGRPVSVSADFSTAAISCSAPEIVDGSEKCVIPLSVTEYSNGLTQGAPFAGVLYIARGLDGSMWFTENGGDRIGKITPAGAITEYSEGISKGARPTRIRAGADGSMWFTEPGINAVGRITPAGKVTEFTANISPGANIFDIASGADGNMWFTEYGLNRIGKITPSGIVTEFSAGITGSGPIGIAQGPDGNMWFTQSGPSSKIAKITPSGAVTEFSILAPIQAAPIFIVAGPDGNMWFTERVADRIGKINMSGVLVEYAIQTDSNPWDITVGPDGNIWFTEDHGIGGYPGVLWRISTAGLSTKVASLGFPRGIAAGSDGNIWATPNSNKQDGYYDFVMRQDTIGNISKFEAGISKGAGSSTPSQIIDGKDGNMWFVGDSTLGLGQAGFIAPDGSITVFPSYIGNSGHPGQDMAVGADGAIYIARHSELLRITRDGNLTSLSFVSSGGGWVHGVARGVDGNIWFVDSSNSRIGKLTPDGAFTFFSSGISGSAGLSGLIAGSDGNMWFTETAGNLIGRITPAGVVTEFGAGLSQGAKPTKIVAGIDGNLWFIESGLSRIGRITPAGVITEYSDGILPDADLRGLAPTRDGGVLYSSYSNNSIGMISVTGKSSEFKVTGLTANAGITAIAAGPGGKYWFTEGSANKIGVFSLP